MKLVILDKHSIQEQERMAIKYFSHITNKNLNNSTTRDCNDTYKKLNDHIYRTLEIVPIENIYSIVIAWVLPSEYNYPYNRVLDYITFVLSYNGVGSIYDTLYELGYITEYGVSIGDNNKQVSSIELDVKLTDKGFEKRFEITESIINYVQNIPINDKIYNDQKQLSYNQFINLDSMEPYEFVSMLTAKLYKYDYKNIIYGTYKYDDFNKELIKKYVNLMSRNRAIVMYTSRDFVKNKNKKEKNYEILYRAITDKQLPLLDVKFKYIEKNPYISKIKLLSKPKQAYIYDKEKNIMYNRSDYKVMMTYMSIYIDKLFTCEEQTSLLLHNNEFIKRLVINGYYSHIAGYTGFISVLGDGINIVIGGYSNKIYEFLELFFKIYFDNYKSYKHAKAKLLQDIDISRNDSPFVATRRLLKNNLYKYYYEPEQIKKYVEQSDDQIYNNINKLLQCKHIYTFIQGDLNKEIYNNIVSLITNHFNNITPNHKKYNDIYLDPKNKLIIEKPLITSESNSAIMRYYYNKDVYYSSDRKEELAKMFSIIQLFVLINDNYFFDDLRTKKQFGYIAKLYSYTIGNISNYMYGFVFLVQSPRYKAIEINNEIDKFIEDTLKRELSNDEFKTYVKSQIGVLEEKPRNMASDFADKSSKYNSRYPIDFNKSIIDELKKLKKQEYEDYINKMLTTGSSLSVGITA